MDTGFSADAYFVEDGRLLRPVFGTVANVLRHRGVLTFASTAFLFHQLASQQSYHWLEQERGARSVFAIVDFSHFLIGGFRSTRAHMMNIEKKAQQPAHDAVKRQASDYDAYSKKIREMEKDDKPAFRNSKGDDNTNVHVLAKNEYWEYPMS
ncbi:unnamed protein product [Soboliphyme baturini]|uniref:AGC-kinase C-terminal domain-containing protein n=1 Tax=Soboliphyme baturini TaxID=241478 RepID=A0A183IDQ3_9BILA|nr:unnamed protein product [Soboliphyme baturini]